MSRGACPKPLDGRTGCPVSKRPNGCYSDIDHVVPQRFKVLGLLVRKYIYTPDNQERMCRWEHEQKTLTETEALIPSQEFMLDAVFRAVQSGDINLSNRDRQQLENLAEQLKQGGDNESAA